MTSSFHHRPNESGRKRRHWACHLVSSRTGDVLPLRHGPLAAAGAPWLVEYELDEERGRWLKGRLAARKWSLWRCRELLPVENEEQRIELGEGGTPLVRLRRLVPNGVEAWLKEEAQNPTGSFKARGLCVAINRALELGAPGVKLPSAGNAALAAAAYAAAAALPCRLALPVDTPQTIIDSCRLFGAEVLQTGRTLVEAAARLTEDGDGFWDLSTFKEPYRVEGKKTMVFELVEQLGWRLPDWIVYPTGGGTGIVAMSKAFAELRRLGLLGHERCRLVVVQMEGCAPLVEAFRQGASQVRPWSEVATRVWGLRVPRTIADFLVLEAVRKSGGVALTVPEGSVEAMQQRAAAQEGVLVGPEGAAALLGLFQLIEQGAIGEGERVAIFQTGHPSNYA